MVSDGPMSHGKVCVLTESLHRVIESFIVSYRNRTYRIIATEFAYWAPNIESMEVNSESNPLERKDAEGPSLDESLENEEHLDVDSCDSDSPKNVNNDSVSPSSRVLREEDVRGVESDLVDSFEEGEIRDDSVLYNDGCIKDCMEKNLEDDAGEILGVHSQGDCGNVTTDDNEDVTPVIAPEKDSIIAPPSTPPGNDLNIAVESGSSWIDYIGPLTSDEIDSDKRWSYRDPNGNIHGLFSLAQLRSWKDYFPSDLQIWSYYGNVKEAILLHNALSRQTKDAVLRSPSKISLVMNTMSKHDVNFNRIRFYIVPPSLIKTDPWEFGLDIDDSDLHLTPSLHSSNSTHVESSTLIQNPVTIIPGPAGVVQLSSNTRAEPYPSTPNPVRIIPGPAGIVQQAKLLKEKVFILDSDGALMSTQKYMQKIIEDVGEDDDFNSGAWVSATNYVMAFGGTVNGCLGDIDKFLKKGKLDHIVAIVKSCSPNMLGDLNVTLKDISGTIPGTIHHKVIGEGGYGKDITVGAAMILKNVSVFTPKLSEHYLNITMRNVVEVFRKDTVLGSGTG
ncbi:5-oxoprolinase-like protein [Tanacetum coccineum]